MYIPQPIHNEQLFINRFNLYLCRFFQYLGLSFKLPLINLVHAISFPFIYNPLRIHLQRVLFEVFLHFFLSISLVNFNIYFDPHPSILRIQHALLNTIGHVRFLFGSFASLPRIFNDSDTYMRVYRRRFIFPYHTTIQFNCFQYFKRALSFIQLQTVYSHNLTAIFQT